MKYILILILLLLGILFFVNKDNLLSRYRNENKAEVLNSVNSDYESPRVDRMGLTNSSTTKSIVVKNSSSTVKNASGLYNVKWTRYIDGKFYDTLYNQYYNYGTVVNYWLSDFESMKNNGFFFGWFGPQNTVPQGGYMSDHISFNLLGDTEVSTRYNNCSELQPKQTFFKSTNSLEKKLLQFANNKGDTKIGIKAGGEIAAIAVVYEDGGVCAKFTEGCTDGVSCSLKDDLDFLKSYKGKSIKKVIDYHTHDYNTYDAMFRENDSYYVDNVGNNVVVVSPAPSVEDLRTDYKTKDQYNKIIPGIVTEDKVISSDGTGYLYNVPKKAKIVEDLMNNFTSFNKKILAGMTKAQDYSMAKGKRKEPNYQDAYAAIDFAVNKYKSLGVNLVFFEIN